MSSLDEFGKTAQRLARNPLGIIALFIVLVYGIAGFVFKGSIQGLEPNERLPLIWFLVCFPVLVLIAFCWLVARHHTKLYAPEDFQDREGFFRALDPSEQRARLDAEVRELEKEESALTPGGQADVLSSEAIRNSWVLAEELAFREIEAEFSVKIQRQVAVGVRDFGVDGVFLRNGRINIVEIKFTRQSSIRHVIRHAVEQLSAFAADSKSPLQFLLVLVVDTPEGVSPSLVEQAKQHLSKDGISIDLRVFEFDHLKEKYGVVKTSTKP
jgi:hypothetical protein